MKFTISTQKFNEMISKVSTVIPIRSAIPMFNRYYLAVDSQGNLACIGCYDCEQWVKVTTSETVNAKRGRIAIDKDDMKLITKLKGNDITMLTDSENKNEVYVKCGTKQITLHRYEYEQDIALPTREDVTYLLETTESWLYETLTNLVKFTSTTEINQLVSVINFNTKYKRVESLDSHRLTSRNIPEWMIVTENESPFETAKIRNISVPIFKKLLNRNSEKHVWILQDEKYVYVLGGDGFEYVSRIIEGEYFKTENILNCLEDWEVEVDTNELREIVKYNANLVKEDNKKPMVMHSENDYLYTFMHTQNAKSFDELYAKNTMKNDFYIGINPKYILDCMNVAKTETVKITGSKANSPINIYSEDYRCFVLPVNINNDNYATEIKECIERKF